MVQYVSISSIELFQEPGYGAHGWLIVSRGPSGLSSVYRPYFLDDAQRLFVDEEALQEAIDHEHVEGEVRTVLV